jgi:hypothetical protein
MLLDQCHITLVKSNGSRYCGIFLENGLTWNQANQKCEDLGARLPVITTPEENQDILNSAVSN